MVAVSKGKKGMVERRRTRRKKISLDISPGSAQVSVTHGYKRWESVQGFGQTIESTCTITLSCEQDGEIVEEVNKKASDLAYRFAIDNGEKLLNDLKAIMED
jgi:hypothetical protein